MDGTIEHYPGARNQPGAAGQTLAGAGVVLGKDYPEPIAEHAAARARSLAALATIKGM